MCSGGGDAWLNDHKKILEHARGLGYDKVEGVSLPSAVDPNDYTQADKQKWISAMDAFNAWKRGQLAKPESQRWWVTRPWESKGDSGGDSGGGGGGGGGGSGPPDWDNPDPPSGTGPYPDDNIYFPMLVPDYEAPRSLDWGRFMPRGQQRANVRPGDIWSGAPDLSGAGGLLYQPWTSNYQHHFVPDNLWDYRPPELKVGRPKFYKNPLGDISAVYPEPEPETKKPTKPDPSQTDGNPDGTYGADGGYDSVADALADLFGLQDFNNWGDPVFGDSDGDDADAGDTSGESFGGGDIHGW